MIGVLAFGSLMSAALAQNGPTRATTTSIAEAEYPRDAIARGEQGAVRFQLEIDANGRPSNCVITESSGSATLDTATCKLMLENARFSAARDDKGNPVRDTLTSRVRWRFPTMVPGPNGYEMPLRSAEGFPVQLRDELFAQLAELQKTTATVRLDIDETGKLAGCHLLQPTGVGKVDALVCKRVRKSASFKPALTKDGQPTRASITKQVQFHGRGAPVSVVDLPEGSPD